MNITFDELRKIKHQLPTGGVHMIAEKLNIDEQTVRNYFGAKKFENGELVGNHIQPGPDGGIVQIEDETILKAAKEIIAENKANSN
ncbi:MAG: DNA-binding protein [Saprospiraceae bacterium]|nr:DNA-binding protein [Saprospiraceae bacterium]MCB9329109.1 DNA-binding protein [Lewinellaceae bacterium]